MQSRTSKSLETRNTPHAPNDIVEIRYIPLPPEQREAYTQAMRILTKLLIEIVNEEEHLQVDILPKDEPVALMRTGD